MAEEAISHEATSHEAISREVVSHQPIVHEAVYYEILLPGPPPMVEPLAPAEQQKPALVEPTVESEIVKEVEEVRLRADSFSTIASYSSGSWQDGDVGGMVSYPSYHISLMDLCGEPSYEYGNNAFYMNAWGGQDAWAWDAYAWQGAYGQEETMYAYDAYQA